MSCIFCGMIHCINCGYSTGDNLNTVKPVKNGHSKIDKTMILMTTGSLMKVEVLQNAFCNTFDLH